MTAVLHAGPGSRSGLRAGAGWPPVPVLPAAAGVVMPVTVYRATVTVDGAFLTEAGDYLLLETGDLLLLEATTGGTPTGITAVDNGDGTFTLTGPTVVDVGDGTFMITGTAVDNGDGTFTLTA